MKTTVVNIFHRVERVVGPYEVYIGRPTKWGNPFTIGKDGTREQVCDKYIEKNNTPEFKAWVRRELQGKVLVCYCKPARCHGDWLAAVANGEVK